MTGTDFLTSEMLSVAAGRTVKILIEDQSVGVEGNSIRDVRLIIKVRNFSCEKYQFSNF